MVIFVFEFIHNTFLYDTSSDYSALFPNRILVNFDSRDTYCPVCLYLCTYKVLLTQDNYHSLGPYVISLAMAVQMVFIACMSGFSPN